MSRFFDRRRFLQTGTTGAAALGIARASWAAQEKPNERIIVGAMGMGGRGTTLARQFQSRPNVDVAYVCDPDSRRAGRAAEAVAKEGGKPRPIGDFRQILDDPQVDVLVVATPDHWHGPATIYACVAGKHVYVEKPCCHNPAEGEMMIAASRKYNRVVQIGTQRRSWPALREAVARLREGVIGEVIYSRGWYNNMRGPIGHGKPAPVPEWLDWNLWQGPAPRVEYRDNVVHYNWHWFWHWGTGEIGNNGVHALDVCRWGLGVEYPTAVSSGGGKFYFDDDQETPDSQVVTYRFGKKMIVWECFNWHPHGLENSRFGAAFFGREGTLLITGAGYRILDRRDKTVEEKPGRGGDTDHIADFLDAIHTGRRPNADIEQGHKSTLLCHLGSIAHRVGRQLRCDPANGHILDDADAQRLWSRQYEPGWEPKV